jgi:hypothetical protein
LQLGHPMGHVPFSGVVHFGPRDGPGPGTSQQSWLGTQQELPQHAPVVPQPDMVQGGVPHFPAAQNGLRPVHVTPQAPQLWMSFIS